MSIIRVRARGQITLPREVRKAVRLGAGDYLACEVQGDAIVLRKATACPHTNFGDGIWRVVGSAEDREGKNDVSADKHKYLGKYTREIRRQARSHSSAFTAR